MCGCANKRKFIGDCLWTDLQLIGSQQSSEMRLKKEETDFRFAGINSHTAKSAFETEKEQTMIAIKIQCLRG